MDTEILDASSIDTFEDDIFDDEDYTPQNEEPAGSTAASQPAEPSLPDTNNEDDNSDNNDDLTQEVLRLKGISDLSKIKFQDETGAIIERDWKDLSKNERLTILTSGDSEETSLEDDEINFINMLRENQMTPLQYIQALQKDISERTAAYLKNQYEQNLTPVYEIDTLSDDELFALDLIERVGEDNITDEELQQALENAKANEKLYAKQIEGLRTTYQLLEDQQKYEAEQQQIEEAEQDYRNFSELVLNLIESFNSFAGQDIDLSNDDKNDIANYMLTRRESGYSDFYTDMQNPEVATLAAFWLLRGPEILNEMGELMKEAYLRGINDARVKAPQQQTVKLEPTVVVQPQKPTSSPKPDFYNAFGIDDESYLN